MFFYCDNNNNNRIISRSFLTNVDDGNLSKGELLGKAEMKKITNWQFFSCCIITQNLINEL